MRGRGLPVPDSPGVIPIGTVEDHGDGFRGVRDVFFVVAAVLLRSMRKNNGKWEDKLQ